MAIIGTQGTMGQYE